MYAIFRLVPNCYVHYTLADDVCGLLIQDGPQLIGQNLLTSGLMKAKISRFRQICIIIYLFIIQAHYYYYIFVLGWVFFRKINFTVGWLVVSRKRSYN